MLREFQYTINFRYGYANCSYVDHFLILSVLPVRYRLFAMLKFISDVHGVRIPTTLIFREAFCIGARSILPDFFLLGYISANSVKRHLPCLIADILTAVSNHTLPFMVSIENCCGGNSPVWTNCAIWFKCFTVSGEEGL